MDSLSVEKINDDWFVLWVELIEVYKLPETTNKQHGAKNLPKDIRSSIGKDNGRKDELRKYMQLVEDPEKYWNDLVDDVLESIEKKIANKNYAKNVSCLGLGVLVVGAPVVVPQFINRLMSNDSWYSDILVRFEKN